jgi:predicted Zn-dependent protease
MAGRVEDIEALRFDQDHAASTDERVRLNLERRTRLALAERAYQAALRLDPAHAPARIHLGRVLFLLDRNDESRRLLEPLVDAPTLVAPARYLATLFLAAVLERAGDLDGARARLAGVPAFAPGRQTAWLALADLELRAGRVDEARHIVQANLVAPGAAARDEWWGYRNGAFQVEDLAWLRSRVYR